MQRRRFLEKSGAIAGLATLAAPALAQSSPSVKWRMSTSWPKSLDTMYGSAEQMCKRIGELTDGKFDIRPFAGGELVPPAQNMEAISNGTIECNHVLASAFIGKNTAVAFDTGLPFGLNARQHNAWMQYGGGMQAMRELYKKYNVVNFVCGNVGVQMGGWYRKQIKTVADLDGLKIRIGGIGGMVMSKMGAVPQQIAAADIYPALEKGTIDAAEWIGPYDDQKLGFNKVAPFYYYPGWWEGGLQLDLYINQKAFDALNAEQKAIVESAAAHAHVVTQARYDVKNPLALKQLVGAGAKLRPFPADLMTEAFKTSMALYDELSQKNQNWAKVYGDLARFRADQNLWFRFTEATFDRFMQSQKLG